MMMYRSLDSGLDMLTSWRHQFEKKYETSRDIFWVEPFAFIIIFLWFYEWKIHIRGERSENVCYIIAEGFFYIIIFRFVYLTFRFS